MNSPRNELIPTRLFRMLGEICEMHGKSHDDLMQMPQIATGLGNDLVHPRFIASMLRLGDLLDIDDNRFCPVMLRIAGDLSAATLAHIDKHHAIRHLLVDTNRIEARAVCTTYDGYVATENWFDYLRQEIAWQMAHWNDIVPDKKFGLLPTVGDISTQLEGYELAENRTRPRFQLDQSRVMELIQGAGLYTLPRDILRELVQNAVDATLLFVWLKHGAGEAGDLPAEQTIQLNDNPYDSKIIKILRNYPIHIRTSDVTYESDAATRFARIRISDSGAGISRDDLASVFNIGSSFNGGWKSDVYERMPLWMRPSGAFGIGLQSVFMLADEVTFETKSILNGETLKIRMSSPTGAENGAVYIVRAQDAAVARKTGTTIEFEIKKKSDKRLEFQGSPIEPYDPTIQLESNRLFGVLDNLPVPAYYNDNEISPKRPSLDWHYYPASGMAIALDLKDVKGRLTTYFKGQEIRASSQKWVLPCSIYVNIYGDANELLTINRRELKNKSTYEKIKLLIIEAAKSSILQKKPAEEKAILSTLLLSLGAPSSAEYLSMRWQPAGPYGIRQYVYVSSPSSADFPSIGEILNRNLEICQNFESLSPRYVFDSEEIFYDAAGSISLFFEALEHQGYNGYVISVQEKSARIGISNDKKVEEDSVCFDLLNFNLSPGLRSAIPIPPGFEDLASIDWRKILAEYPRSVHCPGRGYMYSPFIVTHGRTTTDGLDKLIEWTFANRLNGEVTLEAVRVAYQNFIRYADGVMPHE